MYKIAKEDLNTVPRNGFLRLPQVLRVIPVSKTTWWAGVKSGQFPAAIKLSERVTVWRAEEIWKYIENTKGL